MNAEVENFLATEMDGKVYEHVWLMYAFRTYYVHKDYYFIKNGVVYSLNGDKEIASGDTLFDTQNQCYCLGKRNTRRKYTRLSYQCTPKELNEKLFTK